MVDEAPSGAWVERAGGAPADRAAEPGAPSRPEETPTSAASSPAQGRGARRAIGDAVAVAVAYVALAHAGIRRGLARIDPNDDPEAEPLTLAPLVALAIAIGYSAVMFWRWRLQPMQDLGHHIALSAVVADYHNPRSIYPALYEPFDPTYANTLLYAVAGYSGRLVGVVTAVRACVVFYLAGVPLANLYALRVFGRSPWAAVLSVPLTYNMNYVAGFANILFAAPFMVLTLPVFYRALHAPSWRRVLAAAIVFVLVFLAHAHSFLWIGALTAAMAVAAMASAAFGKARRPRDRIVRPLRKAGVALACVAPSLLLFARWYSRTFGAGRASGGVTEVTGTWDDHYGAAFKTLSRSLHDIGAYTLKTVWTEDDMFAAIMLAFLLTLAIAIHRLQRSNRPPVMECAFALTFLSYFYLPESIAGQDVIASRQVPIALWFVATFASPVRRDVSRWGRWLVIGGILALTWSDLRTWYQLVAVFEAEDTKDILCALDAAPPRLALHYVKLLPNTSKVFSWKPTWHVDKLYMGDRFGETPDNPALNSTSPIRFREGVDFHRIQYHPSNWYQLKEIWDNFELVLVHGATPVEHLKDAKEHAARLRKCGDWELWRRHGGWETGEAPAWVD